jgi:hypothetical protein
MGRKTRSLLASLLLAPASAWAAADVGAMTERYCTKCHNETDWAGGLDLASLDHGHVGANAAEWEKVVLKLRAGMMPPPGNDRPSQKETKALLTFLEKQLDAGAEAHAAPSGLHRLNRREYANAIRDLFGFEVDVTGMLPSDDASEGFDNVAAGLAISPALVQGYVGAAMKLARLAVGDLTTPETTTTYPASAMVDQSQRLEGLALGSRGGMSVVHYFPVDAEYRIGARSSGRGFGGGQFNGGQFNGGQFDLSQLISQLTPGEAPAPGQLIPRGQGNGAEGAGGQVNPRQFNRRGQANAGAEPGVPNPNAGRQGNAGGQFNADQVNIAQLLQGQGNGGQFNIAQLGLGDFAGGRGGNGGIDIHIDGQRVEARNQRVRVKAGHHVITAAMFDTRRGPGVNDIYAGGNNQGGIESLEIIGPFNATAPGDTESRRRIFICTPRSAAEERGCAERIIVNFASRAFRGPQRLADLDVITQFYERGHAEGGFEAGIQQAISRVLVDPRFLFRFEEEPANTPPNGRWTISDLELASRLSFFLWSSIPDQQLIDVAQAGKLQRPEVLAVQVKRMLADPRSEALVDNFAGQWLYLRELATVSPEIEGFDENLRQSFIAETKALVGWVLSQDRPITELLTADYSFLNERLARHYGIEGVRGTELRMVKLPAGAQRRGVLGHGSVLTVTSTPTRTSPVIRGAWILGNILGAPPPNPPPGVETNIDGDGTQVITTTVRERLEAHRANPSCGSCHGVIDPVGFALENFSAIGAWRTLDGESPVDARGTLVDGTEVEGLDALVKALQSHSDLFARNVTQKLLTYALGRALDHRDMPTVRAIVRQAGSEDLRFGALIMAVVQSPAFRQGGHATEPVHVATR